MCEAWGIVDSFRSFCFAHIHFSFFYALGVLAGVWGRVILLVEKIGAGVFGGNSFFCLSCMDLFVVCWLE